MSITEQAQQWGIADLEYIGDGAYAGNTLGGFAIFTSDGVSITRPIFIDEAMWRRLVIYGNKTLEGE